MIGALMCLASCVSEELEVQETTGEEVWCTLDFSDKNFEPVQISTKATLDITQESRIHNMYVFLFTQNGHRIYSRYFDKNNKKETLNEVTGADVNCWYTYTNDNGYTGGTIRIKAPTATNATLYLIANLDEDMLNISSDLLNTITTIDEIEALNVNVMQTTTSRNGYFPMTGRLDGVTVNTTSISAGTAYLERLDSKITINVKLAANQELKAFVPESCIIRNLPAGSRVANASSTSDYEEAGYFDSEMVFEEQTTSADGFINSASCSFYMLENRESDNLKNRVSTYHARDQRIKNADGSYNTDNGLWLNAPENATYLEIKGEVHMEIDTEETGMQELIGDVTYYIHLGNFKADQNNYDVLRNTHYTYNVTIHGVDQIRVEVEQDIENQSGATGHVYSAIESNYTFDAHYGQRVFAMHAEGVDIEAMTFYVKTPFGREGTPELLGGGYNISDLDYKWVKFLVNEVETGTQRYSENNRIYPGDESQMLIAQGKSERLMNVVELLDYVKKEKVKYDEYKAAGFKGTNPSAFLKNAKGEYVINITAFINEFHYETHPTENKEISWKDFVNQPNRLMHILCDTKSSKDGASSVTESIVTFRQRSIQTPYNLNKAEVTTAFGCEVVDETREMNLTFYENDNNYKGVNLGNNSNENGTYNTACLWNLFSNGAFKTGNRRELWSTYLDYETPNADDDSHNHFLRDGKVCMRYSVMARNRDNNGNGYIDPEEVRWYLAPLQQLYTLYVGDLGITAEAQLYPSSLASLPNSQVNGVWQWRNHIVCSNQTNTGEGQYVDKYWPDMLWAEEGVSVSGYGQEWGKPSTKSVRCVRNLGLPYPTETSIADKNANIPDPIIKPQEMGNNVYRFDLSNINDKSVRYYTSHELIPNDENGESSRTYYGFETYSSFQSYSGSYTDLKRSLESGDSPCPDGYRVPNVREAALMSLFCSSQWWGNGEIFSCSYYSHGSLGGDLYYDNGTTTWTFRNKYVTMSGNVNSLRCVKDIDP
jgi:hypothetical protein